MTQYPFISIIVQNYSEKNKKYLDLCMESIQNLEYPQDRFETILVCHKSFAPTYPNVKTISPDMDVYYGPEGLNFGFRHASPQVDYYFMANDDVVFTRQSLWRMVMAEREREPAMINAISPCDNGRLYSFLFAYKRDGQNELIQLQKQFYEYDELAPDKKYLMNASSLYPVGIILQPFLCMFATLIPKKIWDDVGEFDENFKTGQDDIDYCQRAQIKGYKLAVALDAVIWHFGGVTSSETINNDLRVANVEYFRNKWGHLPVYTSEESLQAMKDNTLTMLRS